MAISLLDSKIKLIPEEPGVYLMKDSAGGVLYVGKAKNLKHRVLSYFQERSSAKQSPRTELLVKKIEDLEFVVTDNEVEALILECNLIKKYKPRFNVRLKDDKSYPYVRLDLSHDYPRLEYVRRIKKEKDVRYFGPYVSAYQIKDVLEWAKKAFQLRDCSDNEFRNRSRPCILYQMKHCAAPCMQWISTEDYQKNIEKVLMVLDGKIQEVIHALKQEMLNASESENYERAASLRDLMSHLIAISEQQKITDPESELSRDVVHFERQIGSAVVVVLSVRDGRTIGVLQFPFENLDSDYSDSEFMFQFLAQYYVQQYENAPKVMPEEVLIPDVLESLKDQTQVLSRALGKTCQFRIPKRGEANALLEMVQKTARYHLTQLTQKMRSVAEDLIDTQKKLSLKKFPHRIECFDISHFQGSSTVASRAVLIDGKPEKKLYRHYHVHEVDGPDDFKSLKEILERRFSSDSELPDLVVIDGGKGQLSQAEYVFQILNIENVELVSLAKARTKSGFQDTEIIETMERVFKPNQKNPILLKPGTGAFRIMSQVRNESHRFAIEFHRKTREKKLFKKKSL